MAGSTIRRPLRLLQIAALSALLQTTSGSFAQAQTDSESSDTRVHRAIEKVEEMAKQQIAEGTAVGMAIGVVHKDKLIYVKGLGLREIGKQAQVDGDTVFQLASCSKPISATVVAGLIGTGKITWDSRVCDLDPEFQMNDSWVTHAVTLRDLFAHRSGLPEHAGDLLEDMGYDRNQVLHQIRYQKQGSSFRSTWAYTNFGLTEAAVAAAKAYGSSWESASEEQLFKPLGMHSTSSRYSDFMARPNKALSHVRVNGNWAHTIQREPDAQSPAGGISSSVNDLALWMRMRINNGKFEGKQIIAEKPLVETQHPLILTQFNPFNGLPGFSGLGINVNYDEHGRLHLGHSGGFCMGAATAISMVPSEQLGIIVLTNSYPVGLPEALTATFTDIALAGQSTQDWLSLYKKVFANPATLGVGTSFDYAKAPASPDNSLGNGAYLGTYTNDLYGDISIVESDGHLAVIEGPKNMTFPLKHYNRDTFTYLPPGENSPGTSGITFEIAADGKAAGMCIENLNEFGQGIFHRKAK